MARVAFSSATIGGAMVSQGDAFYDAVNTMKVNAATVTDASIADMGS